jgi:hypothetical protein
MNYTLYEFTHVNYFELIFFKRWGYMKLNQLKTHLDHKLYIQFLIYSFIRDDSR